MNKLIERYFERGITLIEAVNKDDKATAIACVTNEIMSMEEAKLLWDRDVNRPVFDDHLEFNYKYLHWELMEAVSPVTGKTNNRYMLFGYSFDDDCKCIMPSWYIYEPGYQEGEYVPEEMLKAIDAALKEDATNV